MMKIYNTGLSEVEEKSKNSETHESLSRVCLSLVSSDPV